MMITRNLNLSLTYTQFYDLMTSFMGFFATFFVFFGRLLFFYTFCPFLCRSRYILFYRVVLLFFSLSFFTYGFPFFCCLFSHFFDSLCSSSNFWRLLVSFSITFFGGLFVTFFLFSPFSSLS